MGKIIKEAKKERNKWKSFIYTEINREKKQKEKN